MGECERLGRDSGTTPLLARICRHRRSKKPDSVRVGRTSEGKWVLHLRDNKDRKFESDPKWADLGRRYGGPIFMDEILLDAEA